MPSSAAALSRWSNRSRRAKELTSARIARDSGARPKGANPKSVITMGVMDSGPAPSVHPGMTNSSESNHMLTTANPFDSKTILEGIRRWVEIDTPTEAPEQVNKLARMVAQGYRDLPASIERVAGSGGCGDHIMA